MTGRTDMKAVTAAIVTLLVWSSAFAGISVVVGPGGGYGAGPTALLRFLVASATMAVIAVATRMRLPKIKDLPRIAAAAIFGITIYHLAFTFGETRVSAGAAALIIASGPIWTALLAIWLLGERLNRWGWTGVGLAFAGVAAISLGEGGGFQLEPMALLVLAAALSTAVYFVIGKKSLETYSSLEFTSYVIWIGVLPMLWFLPDLLRQIPTAPASSTWTIVFLGVFPGALAYFLWSYALSRMSASTTASFLYAQPVLATLVAWAWQGTVPSPVTLAGGALALVGVVLVQTMGRPRGAVAVRVAVTESDRTRVRVLVLETMDRIVEDFGLDPGVFTEEIARFDDWYGGERGRALLATVDGAPAACVLFRPWGEGHAELRRMYVRPPFRRRGLARTLLNAAAEEAASLGYERLVLTTSAHFEGAAALYEAEGFIRIEPYRQSLTSDPLAFSRVLHGA